MMEPETKEAALPSIRKARLDDIPGIIKCAEASKIQNPPQASFLVSQFTGKDYSNFIMSRNAFVIIAETKEGESCGFLVGYNHRFASSLSSNTSEAAIFQFLPDEVSFCVLKQIAVSPAFRKDGVGSRLFDCFLATPMVAKSDLMFSAIVSNPRNLVSEQFHIRHGFRYAFTVTLPNQPSMPRSIWYRWQSVGLPPVTYSPLDAAGVKQDAVSESRARVVDNALDAARDLYQHEDELNWRKFSLMATFFFAQAAAAWTLLTDDKADRRLMLLAILVLTIAGTFILHVFRVQIRSGLLFMSRHKVTCRLLEAEISNQCGTDVGVLLHVPKKSKTVKWLRIVSHVTFYVWIAISVFIYVAFFRP